jgi:flagellar biosynthesis/type III secretory pathway protein FliH
MVTQSDHDWAKNEAKFRAELEARSWQPLIEKKIRENREKALVEGRAEGLSEGRGEGRAQGDLIGRIQLCQRLLRLPEVSGENLANLSLDELQAMAELLEKQLAARVPGKNGVP